MKEQGLSVATRKSSITRGLVFGLVISCILWVIALSIVDTLV